MPSIIHNRFEWPTAMRLPGVAQRTCYVLCAEDQYTLYECALCAHKFTHNHAKAPAGVPQKCTTTIVIIIVIIIIVVIGSKTGPMLFVMVGDVARACIRRDSKLCTQARSVVGCRRCTIKAIACIDCTIYTHASSRHATPTTPAQITLQAWMCFMRHTRCACANARDRQHRAYYYIHICIVRSVDRCLNCGTRKTRDEVCALLRRAHMFSRCPSVSRRAGDRATRSPKYLHTNTLNTSRHLVSAADVGKCRTSEHENPHI